MDIERHSKNSKNSYQHNQDRTSFRSSVMSLERMSERRHSSLSHRVSLIEYLIVHTAPWISSIPIKATVQLTTTC